MAYDPNEVQAYIREASARRGIDPETALRVFKQESSFNPEARNISDREESYGVAQLNAKGGLGVHALQKGINIRDPSTWRAQMDFALDTVAKVGWGQWYGARDVGIGKWDGIGGRPPAGAGRAPGGVSNRALSPTSVAQQFVPSGTPAPAAFGDVVASNLVQTEAVRPSFGQIAQTFFADRRAAQEERRNEEEAEASRKAALFGGSLFGLYG